MKTLVISSSFTFYNTDELGIKQPQRIDNNNSFLENIQKVLTKRDCCVIISGNPKKIRKTNHLDVNIKGFEMSDIGFKEYIYVDENNKNNIKEYIAKADCIDLCGGHLPTCNAFINELNLKELLKDFDGVIIGASGGGMNLADNVYCIPENEGEHINKNFNRHLKGLALTNINIVPHYNVFKDKVFSDGKRMLEDILLKDSYDVDMIALPDGSYIIQKDDKKVLYGEAYLISKGTVTKICDSNETVKIN